MRVCFRKDWFPAVYGRIWCCWGNTSTTLFFQSPSNSAENLSPCYYALLNPDSFRRLILMNHDEGHAGTIRERELLGSKKRAWKPGIRRGSRKRTRRQRGILEALESISVHDAPIMSSRILLPSGDDVDKATEHDKATISITDFSMSDDADESSDSHADDGTTTTHDDELLSDEELLKRRLEKQVYVSVCVCVCVHRNLTVQLLCCLCPGFTNWFSGVMKQIQRRGASPRLCSNAWPKQGEPTTTRTLPRGAAAVTKLPVCGRS
jgi:hypothetical protein